MTNTPPSLAGSAAEAEEAERQARGEEDNLPPREPSPTPTQVGRSRLETIRVAYEDEMSQADPLLPPELRSLKGRVRKYALQQELAVTDIVDCGRGLQDEEPRYAIKYALTKPVFDTVNKMQLVLNSLAAYLPERTHTYQIDPKNTFRDILLNAASLEELQLAWVGLTGRLMGAQQVYNKYYVEALKEQGARHVDLVSQPATTPSTIYREIEAEDEPHRRLRLALGGLPNSRPTPEERAEGRRTGAYLGTDVRRMIVVPPAVEESFPPREPEANPKLLYYDERNRLRAIPPKTTYENPLGYSPVESPKRSQEEGSSGHRGEEPPPSPARPPPVPPRPPRRTPSVSSSSSTSSSSRASPTRRPRRSGHSSTSDSSASSSSSSKGRSDKGRRHRKARRSAFHEMRLQPIEEEDPPPSDPDDSSSDGGGSWGKKPRRREKKRKEEKERGRKKGGGGGDEPPGEGPNSTGAARTPVAGINPLIKPESLPSWDGNRNTVMVYFWNIVELARQGGRMPQALGEWLWSRLVANSPIQWWYMTLSETRKDHMRQSHRHYISAIRRHYLGPAWISALSSEFRMQHFRDTKNPRESPQDFVYRRIMYCWSLDYASENSRQEAKLIMDVAPKGWKLMLNFTSVRTTDELLARVIEHSEDLLLAYHRDRKLEGSGDRTTPKTTWRTSSGAVKSTPQAFDVEVASSSEAEDDPPLSGEGASPDASSRDLLAVAYAVAAKRAAAVTSYPFPARHDVKSKGKKPPPGPCFACGSPNHWNKDCPHWEDYERRRRETGMSAETAEDLAYDTAYVLVVEQGFDGASRPSAASGQGGSKTQEDGEEPTLEEEEVFVTEVPPFVSRIEEITEEYWHNGECLPIDSLYDLECVVEDNAGVSELEGRGMREEINLASNREETPDGETGSLDEALLAVKPYEPEKLNVRGRVGSALDMEINLRVDSGASVTLVSLNHYRGLISPPPLRTDEGSQLMQLTSRKAPVRGKVRLSFQIFANDGTVLEAECEVQIVEGMTVPVLLGEDFQQAYELSVTRTLEIDGSSSTTLTFGGAPDHPISATPVRRTKDYDRIAKSFLGEIPAEKIVRATLRRGAPRGAHNCRGENQR
ncbi:uncharacterized protein SCHCODRAFT_02688882 [Schizophyllum commune H4-8]|nr:uncharacterized protein SCHCODRAFT_02688882 [Schizophyllum commune H4-8]KAI5892568.1 hypothetical protein SCHCODRAFT_02688882 [Schizophyllum commune H4-8]